MKVCKSLGWNVNTGFPGKTPGFKIGVTLFRHKYSALNSTAVPYLPISNIKEPFVSQQTATGPSDDRVACDCRG